MHLGPSWRHLGAILAVLEAILTVLEAILGVLGASWAVLGPSWGPLVGLLGRHGVFLGPLGPSRGLFGCHWAMLGVWGAIFQGKAPKPSASSPSRGPFGAVLGSLGDHLDAI